MSGGSRGGFEVEITKFVYGIRFVFVLSFKPRKQEACVLRNEQVSGWISVLVPVCAVCWAAS